MIEDIHILLRFIDAHLAVEISKNKNRVPDPKAVMDSLELLEVIDGIKSKYGYKNPTYLSGRLTKS